MRSTTIGQDLTARPCRAAQDRLGRRLLDPDRLDPHPIASIELLGRLPPRHRESDCSGDGPRRGELPQPGEVRRADRSNRRDLGEQALARIGRQDPVLLVDAGVGKEGLVRAAAVRTGPILAARADHGTLKKEESSLWMSNFVTISNGSSAPRLKRTLCPEADVIRELQAWLREHQAGEESEQPTSRQPMTDEEFWQHLLRTGRISQLPAADGQGWT